MGLDGAGPPPLDDREPSPAWVAQAMGLSLEEAEWLLVLYRFAPPEVLGGCGLREGPTRIYFCEPL